jgi:hypothetical protein
MAEYLAYFITGYTLGNEQHPVQAVIIPRFFGAKDFVAQGDLHNLSISKLQTSHLASLPKPIIHEGWREYNNIMLYYL